MITDRWDLTGLDRAADRARLWAWLPLAVVGLTLLGYLGSIVLTLSLIVLQPGRWLVLVATIPTLLPLVGGIGVNAWRLRGQARHLPGPPLTLWERLPRVVLVAGVVAIPIALAVAPLQPYVFLPVLCAVLLGWLGFVGLFAPSDRWSPPRPALVAQAAALGIPPALVAAVVWWNPVAPALSFGAIVLPLVVVGWMTRRRVLALYALRGEGRHGEAVAALTTWRSVGAAPVVRAAILLHAGRVEDALELCLDRARRVPRTHWVPTVVVAAECARLLGRTREATELTDALLAIAPDRPEGYLVAASLALDAEAPPDACVALLDRAATHVERGNTFGGTSALTRAALVAWRARLGLLRATALARAGQTADASHELDAALAQVDRTDRPAAARLLFESLRAHRALGRDEAPTRALIQELDPEGIGAWLLRSHTGPGGEPSPTAT